MMIDPQFAKLLFRFATGFLVVVAAINKCLGRMEDAKLSMLWAIASAVMATW